MPIFVFGTIPSLGDGRRFFGIRYVWMDYSQSTASAVLRHADVRKGPVYETNLNSTASAVLRWESRKSQNQCILALSIIMVPYKRF